MIWRIISNGENWKVLTMPRKRNKIETYAYILYKTGGFGYWIMSEKNMFERNKIFLACFKFFSENYLALFSMLVQRLNFLYTKLCLSKRQQKNIFISLALLTALPPIPPKPLTPFPLVRFTKIRNSPDFTINKLVYFLLSYGIPSPEWLAPFSFDSRLHYPVSCILAQVSNENMAISELLYDVKNFHDKLFSKFQRNYNVAWRKEYYGEWRTNTSTWSGAVWGSWDENGELGILGHMTS